MDAYPPIRIDDTVSKVAEYTISRIIDLQSAYHQIPISFEERPYMAFETNG